jgi:hypothetical protein
MFPAVVVLVPLWWSGSVCVGGPVFRVFGHSGGRYMRGVTRCLRDPGLDGGEHAGAGRGMIGRNDAAWRAQSGGVGR